MLPTRPWRSYGNDPLPTPAPVAAPLAFRQHGVGVGLLLEDEAPVPPALGTPQPVEDPELAQPPGGRAEIAHRLEEANKLLDEVSNMLGDVRREVAG
jgi:hypothetical protein